MTPQSGKPGNKKNMSFTLNGKLMQEGHASS